MGGVQRYGSFARRIALSLLCLALIGVARADPATPIPGWMRYEQKLLSRQLDASKIMVLDNKQEARFAPEQGKTFAIKSYWLDADKLDAFTGDGMPASIGKLFFRNKGGARQVRLLVHPESEAFYRDLVDGAEESKGFFASSTASSRTLLVWPKGRPKAAFFAKLSLDKEVGGVVRTIPRGEVARSIGVNNVLYADRRALPSSFKYLPEVVGVMPKAMLRGGMIIRAIPEEVTRGDVEYVPLFSLYAQPGNGGPPLLAKMINASGLSADKFVTTRIIRPFVKQWLALSVGRGIVSEAHAQNVLIELKDGRPTGKFVHRDFGGFNIDLAYREKSKLPQPSSLPVIESVEKDYHQLSHDTAIDQSLDTYFVGGFVYNLDAEIPKWEKAGWVKPQKVRTGSSARYTDVLRDELKAAYEAQSGSKLVVNADLKLARQVKTARQIQAARR